MSESTIIGPYGYSGGLNTDASLITLPKGQASALQNMVILQEQLVPIAGYSHAGITQPPVVSGQYYPGMVGFTLSGHNYLILFSIHTGGSGVTGALAMEDFTGAWSGDISNSTGVVGFFESAYCVEVMNNVAFFGVQGPVIGSAAPSGNISQWSGSGNFAAVTTPAGAGASGIIKQVNNFMFLLLANGTLYWSSVGDGTNWPATNFLTFRFGDQDLAVALGKIGNTLYIFKLNCIGALQTTTVVLAGAVTLGPLYPLFEKIGTFSMRSLDNLPTGEIVFLGTDFNVYKFDGSNLTNLSNRPYPRSSIQGAINAFVNSNTLIGSNLLWIRVNPLTNSVYLTMGGQDNFGATSATICFAYDYVQDYWYKPTSIFSDLVYLPAIGAISGFIPTSVSQLFLGLTSDGTQIDSISSNYTTFNGSAISGQAVISIPYTFESRDTVPLTSIMAYQMNVSDTLTITQGNDGIYKSSSVTPTINGNLQRIIIPLTFSDSSMTAQVKIATSTSNAYSINPLVLDQEYGH